MRKPTRRPAVRFPRTPVSLAILSLFGGVQLAIAQEAPPAPAPESDEVTELENVVVTATRRDKGVQDIPFNISAVRREDIERQNLTDMESLARVIPGVFLLNQGARAASLVVVRGLNTSSIAASEGNGNANGGVMATYIGDIPLYVDLKLLDLDRVEVLLGPQGTLYGAGTLGGALRYIPNRADTELATFELDAGTLARSHSDSLGSSLTLVANQPISETLAVRAAAGYYYDPGFIDYNNLVREAGVSDPEPDAVDIPANLRRKKDVDDETTTVARVSLGMQVTPALRGDLTLHYQKQEVGGRTVNHVDSYGTGPYESGHRFVEPNDRENQLFTLELNADLAFARLTSATGFSSYDEVGQRDQTDLLLNFEYGYEDFPSFSAYTRETNDEKSFNQELRLVSTDEGPFNWIAGVFYNEFELDATSSEFTPGIPAFFGVTRPDNLEYYQASFQTFTESAIFGEVGYEFSDRWQGTLGARWFDFQDDQRVGFDLPLISGTPPDQINPVFSENEIGDDDIIFKANAAYEFSGDMLGYATLSEGYRSGGVNAVPPCQNPLPPGQNVCALPNEQLIKPDKTLNHEIGLRSAWMGGRLVVNGALFFIDWTDVQVSGITVNGAVPILVNAGEARSQGLELSTRMRIASQFRVTANYSYTDAELTKDAPSIVEGQDAFKGDRLPASPKHQGNISVAFDELLPNGWNINADYGIFAISDVYSRLGLRAGGEKLPGFAVHSASIGVGNGPWKVRLFANNLFDKYAETGLRASTNDIRTIDGDADGDGVVDHTFRLRRYYKDVLEPFTVGIRLSYDL